MDWQEISLTVLQTVLIVIVPYIVMFIKQAIEKLAAKFTAKADNDMVAKYIEISKDALSNIVTDIGENYVKQLKQDNKFTVEAQETALNMAKDRFKEMITEEAQNAMETVVGDLDSWLGANIETIVAKNK